MSCAACEFAGPRRAWEDETATGVSDGVAVRPSCRTKGGSNESCCSEQQGQWQRLPPAMENDGGCRRLEVRSEPRGRRGRPDAQHELDEHPPWRR
jgi:hypothetical protein